MKRLTGMFLLITLIISSCSILRPAYIDVPQPLSDLALLTMPFAPGQREISFRLGITANTSNTEVLVYYSTDASHFNEVSSAMPHGRAIAIFEGKPQYLSCRFILPHIHHTQAPNKRLYERLQEINQAELLEVSDLASLDVNPLVIEKGECVYFRIVKKENVNGRIITTQSDVLHFTMPDIFNIGIPGESYAAGEGAPIGSAGPLDSKDGIWEDCICHRSKRSGIVRGTKLYIHDNPQFAISYRHVACSGAKIADLYQEREEDFLDGIRFCSSNVIRNKPPQLSSISESFREAGRDQVNMIIMSIGGNDIGFSGIVFTYLLLPIDASFPLDPGQAITSTLFDFTIAGIDEKLDELFNGHLRLDWELNKINEDNANNIKPIIGLCTMPNPTTKQRGERCGCDEDHVAHKATIISAMSLAANFVGPIVAPVAGALFAGNPVAYSVSSASAFAGAFLAGLWSSHLLHETKYGALSYENGCLWSPRNEWDLIYTDFLKKLNAKIRLNADEFDWGIIEMEETMIGNGLCNHLDPKINGIASAIGNQGDIFGVVHPNSKGFELYVDPVSSFIEQKYEEYLLTYALSILNECVSLPDKSCSMSLIEQRAVATSLLYNHRNTINNYPDIAVGSIFSSAGNGTSNSPDTALLYTNISLLANQSFYSLLRDPAMKIRVCNSIVSKSIISKTEGQTTPPEYNYSNDEVAENKALKNFLKSTDYTDLTNYAIEVYNRAKQQPKINAEYVWFLDNKYDE